jgi:hypothetical protein
MLILTPNEQTIRYFHCLRLEYWELLWLGTDIGVSGTAAAENGLGEGCGMQMAVILFLDTNSHCIATADNRQQTLSMQMMNMTGSGGISPERARRARTVTTVGMSPQ